MSSPAIALPGALPAKKKAKSKKKAGPSVSDLILKAVSASAQRGGVSLAAVKKVLKAGGYDVVKNKTRISVAIKRLVNKKVLIRNKGSLKRFSTRFEICCCEASFCNKDRGITETCQTGSVFLNVFANSVGHSSQTPGSLPEPLV
uniref:H15 domain-containing protein n=1 Tax=Poecilia latipinna TaxID=48699 RepID=A0A3B3TUH2_9TELE